MQLVGQSRLHADDIPDAVFLRIRGALFLGPAFGVTRNKLTFRDNIAELLKDAPAKDRRGSNAGEACRHAGHLLVSLSIEMGGGCVAV